MLVRAGQDAMEELLHYEDDNDFETEVKSLHNNPESMEFLAQLSQEEAVISMEALKSFGFR